jgi:hypothetical protein
LLGGCVANAAERRVGELGLVGQLDLVERGDLVSGADLASVDLVVAEVVIFDVARPRPTDVLVHSVLAQRTPKA